MTKVQRLRENILSQDYYKRRLQKYMKQEEYWKDFEQFRCEEFFVGRESARINRAIYRKEMQRVRAKIRWYHNKMQENHGNK